MKVSLITLHRVTNFGSLLQTYATQRSLEKMGHICETIDYQPVGLSFYRSVWPQGQSIIKKVIKFLPNCVCNLVQFGMVDRFLNKNIHMTSKRYRAYEDLEQYCPEADVYLSGSDQIWNTQNSNQKDDLKGYYLCYAPENKARVAYAGSFGRTEFPEDQMKQIGQWLKQYNAISVREDTGLEVLEKAGIRDGIHVVDPTLLLSKDEWAEFCMKTPPKPGYIFVYNLNRNKLIEKIAISLAKAKKLRIINFADTFEFIKGADNRLFNTPYDFLNHLLHADYVITDSFHGTAFSINLNKEFVCVAAPKYNSRIESLLRKVDLLYTRLVFDEESALRILDKGIDWINVNDRLNRQRDESWCFLEEAISNGES